MNLRVHDAAEADLRHGIRWYESKQPGLGLDFLTEFDELLPSIRDFPESFAQVETSDDPTLRRAILPDFPYMIVFEILADEIHVLAVQHTARKPKNWSNRRN